MVVSVEPFKYFNNLIQRPFILILMLAGVISLVYSIYKAIFKKYENAILFGGAGTFLAVFSLFLLAGFNNSCFYPSNVDIQSSLNIVNASSSLFTLKTMAVVSLFMPVVLAYIIFAWRSMNKKKINLDDLDSDGHKY
jgi:cytochrome d ubiquinol oxidase subunit II